MTWGYRAPWWLPGGNLQTIYAAKGLRSLGDKPPVWQRQRWETPDNDFVDVDWLGPLAAISYQVGTQKSLSPKAKDTPLLVFFHGLEASSASHYAIAFAQEAQRIWLHMDVPHFVGCNGEINRDPRGLDSGVYLKLE